MDRRLLILLGCLLLGVALVMPATIAGPAKPECKDGIDNDGDGLFDTDDPGCIDKNDRSELNPDVECDDGTDNDGDGAADYNDNGCSDPLDNDETNCGDGICEGGETTGSCPEDCGHEDSCSDTDGGNVIGVFGTTSGYLNEAFYSNNDYCVDSDSVMEFYCNGDYEESQQQSCGTDGYGENYCMNSSSVYRDFTDYFCSNGECDFTVTPEFVEFCEYGCTDGSCNPIPDSCSDTDGGFVTTVQGTVSGYFEENPYSYTDFCNGTILMEYYCSGVKAYGYPIDCAANQTMMCVDGACVTV